MMDEYAEAAQLAREYSIGFVVPPGDAAHLADTLRHAADNAEEVHAMGRRARQVAEEKFDRKIITAKFAEVLAAANPSRLDGTVQPQGS
jgi:glycosyltransferase involved in cell wall biosynthesis